MFEINALEFLKISKLGGKNALFGCFRLQFWKNNVVFGISSLDFILLESMMQKWKSLNLRLKISYLSIFGLEFESDTVIFEINILQFV